MNDGGNKRLDRRKFSKLIALSASGFMFLKNSKSVWSYQANEKLNIAFVGVGGRGRDLVNIFSGMGENIVGLCDVDEEYAADSFNRFPDSAKYRDFRKMIGEIGDKIDAVVVATPDHTHAVAVAAALRAKKHVYCEKPLTRTIFEARKLCELAKEAKVSTQMGNQGTASEAFRRAVELVQYGVIGEVREVHCWIGGGNSPMDRPEGQHPVPDGLDWDLWLGPAEYRPFHPIYIRGRWRNWRAFGSGVLGDFGCHIVNLAFMALKLDELWDPDRAPKGATIRVWGEASEIHPETYSRWVVVHYEFPKRGELPPVSLTWYNGGKKPKEDLLMGHQVTDVGCLLVGSRGSLLTTDTVHSRFVLLPQKEFEGIEEIPQKMPRSVGHYREWVLACKGEGTPMANFGYSCPLTEAILLGNVALQVGHPIEYDPISGRIVNCVEANSLLHREYRVGWEL